MGLLASRFLEILWCASFALIASDVRACDDLTAWPSQISYEPPATVGGSASIVLGPATVGRVGLFTDPASISVNEDVVTVEARWMFLCDIGVTPPPGMSHVPIPELGAGVYTINFKVFGLPTQQFSRTITVQGFAEPHLAIPMLGAPATILLVLSAGWLARTRMRLAA